MKAPRSPLSSRPKRSAVKGSAVLRTPHGNVFPNPHLNLRFATTTRLQHLLRMPQRRLSQFRSAEHARHFFSSFLIIKQPNRGLSSSLPLPLLHQKMLIGKRRDLGQMGDAKYLLRARELLELLSHRVSRPAANPNINLIEDQRARNRRLTPSSSLPASRPLLDT